MTVALLVFGVLCFTGAVVLLVRRVPEPPLLALAIVGAAVAFWLAGVVS